MSDTCAYTTALEPVCPAAATHAVIHTNWGRDATWHTIHLAMPMGRDPQMEFCERHAFEVAEARNAAHLAAKEARLLAPRPTKRPGCAVCGTALHGVGVALPDVGPVCDECHRSSNDEQLDDPRTQRIPKRPRRTRKEAV